MAASVSILLVEDDKVDQMNVQRAFRKNRIENPLFIANDGLEALDMLREADGHRLDPMPRIILLDINMPRMNGIEFLAELREDPRLRSISVFVLTTSNEDQDKMAAYGANVAGYIVKPMDFEKFVTAVGSLNAYWQLCEHAPG